MKSSIPSDCTVPIELREFFGMNRHYGLAFSGGTDSTYLLYAAVQSGADIRVFTVKTEFQTEKEMERAIGIAESMGKTVEVIRLDIMDNGLISSNGPDRCYHCKKSIFESITKCARQYGISIIIDGTNASDDDEDRPGMKALSNLRIVSPLRSFGITKKMVRELSRRAGLETWDLPSNSCLATRIATGIGITKEILGKTEKAESELSSVGFSDFRVRTTADGARFEIAASQSALLDSKKGLVEEILLKYYPAVSYSIREPRP